MKKMAILYPTEQTKIIEQKLMNDYLSLWEREKAKPNLTKDKDEMLNE